MLLSQERVKLRTSNLAGTFTWSTLSEQKSIWNFEEKGALAYPGTAQIFWVPTIISGTGKDTNFKFCTHIHMIDRNKNPLKISEEVANRGHTQGLSKIFRHLYRVCQKFFQTLKRCNFLNYECRNILLTQRWSPFIREFENCRQTCSYHSKATSANAKKQTGKIIIIIIITQA